MISQFNNLTDIRTRDIISTSRMILSEKGGGILKRSLALLLPIAILITIVNTVYSDVISNRFFSSFFEMIDGNNRDVENVALFNTNIIVILSFFKHIATGAFFGIGGYVISRSGFRPLVEQAQKFKNSGIARAMLYDEGDDIENISNPSSLGRVILFSTLLYLPMGIFFFISDMYSISAVFEISLVAIGSVLSWVLGLLYIAYVPLIVLALPFVTEVNLSFRASVSKAWSHYLDNFLYILLAILLATFVTYFFQIGVELSYLLVTFIAQDIFGIYGEGMDDFLFLASIFKILAGGLLMLISILIPLVGYAFYYLFVTTQRKTDKKVALQDFMRRVDPEYRGRLSVSDKTAQEALR